MKRFLITLMIFLCAGVVTVSADSSSSSLHMLEEQYMISYGKYKDYEPALGINPTNKESVDTMSGGLTITETDLTLPGKNGLDFSITRRYSSQETKTRYTVLPSKYVFDDANRPAYKYSYYDETSQTTKYIYIMFSAEEQMYQEYNSYAYIRPENISTNNTYYYGEKSVNGTNYKFFEEPVLTSQSSTTVTLTRDKTSPVIKIEKDLEDINITNTSFPDNKHDLGCGWELLTPWLSSYSAVDNGASGGADYYREWMGEFQTETGAVYSAIHELEHEEGDPFEVFITKKITIENAEGLYTADYVRPRGTCPTITIKGVSFSYSKTITDKYGKIYYFADNGSIQAIIDRYGNSILYKYIDEPYEVKLDYIIDSMNRKITFTYDENRISVITVLDSNDNEVYKIQYDLSVINDYNVDENNLLDFDNAYKLSVVKWENSSHTANTTVYTHYKKEIMHYGGSLVPPEYPEYTYDKAVQNYLYLLQKIDYPTGLATEYSYTKCKIIYMLKSTRTTVYKIASRKDISDGTDKNHYTYSYDMSQYFEEGNSERSTISFPKEQWYGGTATRVADNLAKTEEYNSKCKLVGAVTTAEDYYYREKYRYEQLTGIPPYVQMTMQYYGSLGDSCHVIYNVYNGKCNLIEYAEGDYIDRDIIYSGYYNQIVSDFLNTGPKHITYTYDDTYSNLLTAEYKISDDLYYKKENTLDSTKKNIMSTKEYESSNGITYTEKNMTNYTYDSYGNIASVSSGNSHTAFAYTYNSNGTMSVSETASGLADADGAAVSNIIKTTDYDLLGRPVSVTDGNVNPTNTTYDLLGRTLSVSYPDGTSASYVYNTAANTVLATLQNGTKEMLYYDPFGKLENVYLDVSQTGTPSWRFVTGYTYDSLCRAVTETAVQTNNGVSRVNGLQKPTPIIPLTWLKALPKPTERGILPISMTMNMTCHQPAVNM